MQRRTFLISSAGLLAISTARTREGQLAGAFDRQDPSYDSADTVLVGCDCESIAAGLEALNHDTDQFCLHRNDPFLDHELSRGLNILLPKRNMLRRYGDDSEVIQETVKSGPPQWLEAAQLILEEVVTVTATCEA